MATIKAKHECSKNNSISWKDLSFSERRNQTDICRCSPLECWCPVCSAVPVNVDQHVMAFKSRPALFCAAKHFWQEMTSLRLHRLSTVGKMKFRALAAYGGFVSWWKGESGYFPMLWNGVNRTKQRCVQSHKQRTAASLCGMFGRTNENIFF